MRGLEFYELDNDEVIVNVTRVGDTSEVTNELGKEWTWEASQTTFLPASEEEGATEWLTLLNAHRRP